MAALVVGIAFAAACASAPEAHDARGDGHDATQQCAPAWPLWTTYKAAFVEADGRVVDHFAQHSTSEGQAYTLFHALVAGDEPTFERVLAWTERHLAKGDLRKHLPAWRWAERDGRYQIVDGHAASDADLFIAYVLVHAAVVFGDDRYAAIGGALLARIAAEEVVTLPGLGPMLLPGPTGFDTVAGFWRVNPSYQPVPFLRWAARVDPTGPWARVIESAVTLAESVTPERFYPDWAAWSGVAKRFVSDVYATAPGAPPGGQPGIGSYDAIRAYLWPALMAPEDPLRGRLLARGSRLLEVVRTQGFVPERVDAFDAAKNAALTPGPVGFQVVGQVFALALGDAASAGALAQRVSGQQRDSGLYGEPAFYYDHNLLLFAQGWLDGRYRFGLDGGLKLKRDGATCAYR